MPLCELENSVVVQIKHEKLASIDSIIMEYLDNNDMITNQTARSLTGVKSENSMKGSLNKLRKKGMIEPVPDRSGFKSAWRKTQANSDNEPV
jgi:ATP-dependent DNA helicase RecG